MEPDGDLVLEAAGGRTLWSSGTGDSPGAFALMQPDGNFAIYSASDQVLWETGTEGHPGADLAVESNADLVMYDRSERVWSSGSSNSGLSPGEHLEPGWYLDSPAGTCRLVMKRDGNLVLYASDGRTLWSSETPGSPGAFAVMDSDGNLAVYSASDHLLWRTPPLSSPPAQSSGWQPDPVPATDAEGRLVEISGRLKVTGSAG
jgi:hypothetical protein